MGLLETYGNSIDANRLRMVSVANIDDPSTELNAISGSMKGTLVLAYEEGAGTDAMTLYAWDDSGAAESPPQTVDGSTGLWVAVGGKYVSGVTATQSELNILDGATLSTAELNILDGVTADSDDLNRTDITEEGKAQASKVLTSDANKETDMDGGRFNNLQNLTNLGAKGAGYFFDGEDDVITVADDADLDWGTGDGAIEAWVYMLNVDGNVYFLTRYSGSNNLFRFHYYQATNILVAYMEVLGTVLHRAEAPWAPEAKKWYHLVWTFENGVSNNLYINSVNQALSTDVKSGGDLSLDAGLDVGAFSSNYYKMSIAGAHQWNRHLTQDDVEYLYDVGMPKPEDQWGSQTPIYSSDFSAGDDGWMVGNNVTLAGNIDTDADGAGIPPSNDWLRATVGASGTARYRKTGILNRGKYHLVSGKYFIPSGNAVIDGFTIGQTIEDAENSSSYVDIRNATTDVETTFTGIILTESASLRVMPTDGSSYSLSGADGDLVYIKDIEVTQLGAVASYSSNGVGHNQWSDQSGNELHGAVSGATPFGLPAMHEEAYKKTVTGETTLTDVAPEGYEIESIWYKETAGNNITDFNLGTSDDGQEVVADVTITGSTEGKFTLAGQAASLSAADTLYASAANWNSGSLDLYFTFKRVRQN